MPKTSADERNTLLNRYRSYYDVFTFGPDQACLTVEGLQEFLELIVNPDINGCKNLIPEIKAAIRRRLELEEFREVITTFNQGQFSKEKYEEMESLRWNLDPHDEELRHEIQKGNISYAKACSPLNKTNISLPGKAILEEKEAYVKKLENNNERR